MMVLPRASGRNIRPQAMLATLPEFSGPEGAELVLVSVLCKKVSLGAVGPVGPLGLLVALWSFGRLLSHHVG